MRTRVRCTHNHEGSLRQTTRDLPELSGRERGPRDNVLVLRPGCLGMPAHATVGAGDDVLAAADVGVGHDRVGNYLRGLNHWSGVINHPWDNDLVVRPLDLVAPHLPLMAMRGLG